MGPESSHDALFETMLASGELPIRNGGIFASQPASKPPTWDRIEGMLLGVAIGDALGNTTEGQFPSARAREYGEVTDFLPNRNAGNQRKGTPSDDSQLTFWTVEHLIHYGHLELDSLAKTFASRRISGIGHAMRGFVSGIEQGTS